MRNLGQDGYEVYPGTSFCARQEHLGRSARLKTGGVELQTNCEHFRSEVCDGKGLIGVFAAGVALDTIGRFWRAACCCESHYGLATNLL